MRRAFLPTESWSGEASQAATSSSRSLATTPVHRACSTDRIIYATTEILHRVDDDAIAAAEIMQVWEDAPEVKEVFISPEELAIRFLPTRWRER